MSNSKNNLKPIQKESQKILGEFTNDNSGENNHSKSKEYIKKEKVNKEFHLNSLITKNISLFTKNPNYKMLAWLIVQLTIFSLFIFAVNILKSKLIPYLNS